MKKYFTIFVLYLLTSTLFGNEILTDYNRRDFSDFPSLDNVEFEGAVQKCLELFRSESPDKKTYAKQLLLKKGKKEVIPILVENLYDNDMVFVLEIETMLLRLTGQGFYGVCVGNKSGISDYEKWWIENKDNYKFPDTESYYYSEYFDG